MRGHQRSIPVSRQVEMADSTRHRWSVGLDDVAVPRRWFYLGGPLSLLNAACNKYAVCDYNFSKAEHFAVSRRVIGPGEELTCCYNGADKGKPLTDTGKVIICCDLNCSEFVMHL